MNTSQNNAIEIGLHLDSLIHWQRFYVNNPDIRTVDRSNEEIVRYLTELIVELRLRDDIIAY